MINQQTIENVLRIAKEIASPQMVQEINLIAHSMGKVYDEISLAAEIAVKMMLRLSGVDVQSRSVTPIEPRVQAALTIYYNRYGVQNYGQ